MKFRPGRMQLTPSHFPIYFFESFLQMNLPSRNSKVGHFPSYLPFAYGYRIAEMENINSLSSQFNSRQRLIEDDIRKTFCL